MGTRILSVAAWVMALQQISLADTTATQSFVVTVPTAIDVVTPADSVVTSMDQVDAVTGARVFAAQIWSVTANSSAGVSVAYSVDEPFMHQSDASIKTDAELAVAVIQQTGPASWNVTQATDSTSHASGDNSAMVQVTSDNAGTAQIGLTVTFAPPSPDHVAEGTYTSTVVCTIASPL
jgi:hypothetical protein